MTGLLVRDARLHLRVGNLLAEVHELLPAVHLRLALAGVGGLVKVAAVGDNSLQLGKLGADRQDLIRQLQPSTTTTRAEQCSTMYLRGSLVV